MNGKKKTEPNEIDLINRIVRLFILLIITIVLGWVVLKIIWNLLVGI